MGTVSVSLPSDGTTIDAADYNTPINTIVTEINGNLDNNNIKASAGIDGSKLADASIPATKLATGAITLGYAQTTSSFSSTSSTGTQIPSLSVTVTIPAGGRRVKITAFAADGYSSTAAGYMGISIWDGTVGSGTQLARGQMNATNTTGQAPLIAMAVQTPAAGSKTYNVALYTNTGTANIECGATFPAFILVEAI